MTKSELVDRFADKAKISKQRADLVVDAFFSELSALLAKGARVELRRFGNFSVRQYGSYVGRNPKSGDAVPVDPKRLPYFKVSGHLRELLNLSDDSN